MARRRLVLALLAAPLAAGAAYACTRPAPRYARLAFGPEGRTGLLVRLQGHSLALDRDGDGRFRGADEVFPDLNRVQDVTIPGADGRTSYVIQRVRDNGQGADARLMIHVAIRGPAAFQQYCDVGLADDPAAAPVARFDAPLTASLQQLLDLPPPERPLRRGDRPADLRVNVVTIDPSVGCWVVVRSDEMFRPGTPALPAGVHPVLDAEFPP